MAVARAHDVVTDERPLARRVLGACAFATLAMAPDLDVVGFRLGVAYEDPWGHRGAAHSIVVAAALALAVSWPLARVLRARLLPTLVAALVSVVSHGVLDMLTDGGLGVAAAWPLSTSRFFFPWHPIPVAPIGRAFLSMRGLHCALVELAVGAPFLAYALFARRRARAP